MTVPAPPRASTPEVSPGQPAGAGAATGDVSRSWEPPYPVALDRLLGGLSRGAGDPTWARPVDGAVWRAGSTPNGPGTLRICSDGAGVAAAAWGPGASWLLDRLPAFLGSHDELDDFSPAHPGLDQVWLHPARRHRLRIGRSERALDILVPAILEQKVTSTEARRSWRELVHRYGAPAPGPAPEGLRVAPTPQQWRSIPSWGWHAAGVDSARSTAVLHAARVAGRLEEALHAILYGADADALMQVPGSTSSGGERPFADDLFSRRLLAIPGIGPWTVAETRQRACGDADAVSVGDYHVAKDVGWALAGRPVDDAEMLQLLAPYAGHRYRFVLLLGLSGTRRPRFAPRFSPRDYRRF